MRTQGPIAPRFWSKVQVTEGCWIWTGARTHGYGNFSYGGRGGSTVKAHCFSWRLLKGEIPDGKVLDHTCRNRACVNPAHLEPVTQQINFLRGIHPNAVKHVATNAGKRSMRRHPLPQN